jgi:16S rRNA G966 N2-methylase RsmD
MKAVGSIIRNIAKAARLLRGGQAEELGYQLWNKWKGVDFEFVSLEDLGLSPDRAHFHSSSGGPTLARVFRTVGVPPGSVALDLGSGKGGAALTLSGLGFAEVIGVELSADLVHIARCNAARLKRRNVRFVQSDAAVFSDYDGVTHIYMYNPFPREVMTQVLSNLTASLRRTPRPLTLVYRNPHCHEAIATSGVFDAEAEQRPDEHAWRIYRSRLSAPQAMLYDGRRD